MSVQRQFVDRLCETSYKDKQSAATKRSITKLSSYFKFKDKDNADETNSGSLECTDEDIKEKDEKIEEEFWTPKSSVKKTRKRESYLQQPTKPLQYNPDFKNIHKIYLNIKAEQETEQEQEEEFESDRYSETVEEVGLSDCDIQTPEIIEKSKPDTFITESAGFSAYRHHAVQTELKQKVDQCKFKTKTIRSWKNIPDKKKERF